jgi:hypothetical protein
VLQKDIMQNRRDILALRLGAMSCAAVGTQTKPVEPQLRIAFLGSFYEYTFDSELGAIFVVSPDLVNVLPVGADVSLSLSSHGVSVVAVP